MNYPPKVYTINTTNKIKTILYLLNLKNIRNFLPKEINNSKNREKINNHLSG